MKFRATSQKPSIPDQLAIVMEGCCFAASRGTRVSNLFRAQFGARTTRRTAKTSICVNLIYVSTALERRDRRGLLCLCSPLCIAWFSMVTFWVYILVKWTPEQRNRQAPSLNAKLGGHATISTNATAAKNISQLKPAVLQMPSVAAAVVVTCCVLHHLLLQNLLLLPSPAADLTSVTAHQLTSYVIHHADAAVLQITR